MFFEKAITAQLLEFLDLVKTYYAHAHCRTCWKYNKNECHFSNACYFTNMIIIAKPLDSKLSNGEKEEASNWRNTLIKNINHYIDNNLNPAKVNVIETTKDNFTQPLSVKEILDEFEISKKDYYRPLSISKGEHLGLHLK